MGQKFTFEEVVEYSRSIGYEILEKEYVNCKEKMLVRHLICGYEFEVSFDVLKNKQGCKFCSNMLRKTIEEVVEFSKENGYTVIDKEYRNMSTKINMIHDECGNIFSPTWREFYHGNRRCAYCGDNRVPPYKKIYDRFMDSGYVLISKKYKKAKEPLKVKHISCGTIFVTSWDKFCSTGEKICKKCNKPLKYEKIIATRIKNRGSFGENFPELLCEWSENNEYSPFDYTPSSNYVVLWKCKIHGEYSMPISLKVQSLFGCQLCAEKSRRITVTKTMISKNGSLKYNYPSICDEWSSKNEKPPEEYTSASRSLVWWVCPNGHPDYSMEISNRTKANMNCPLCGSYKGSDEIERILKYYGFIKNDGFYREYSFPDCKYKQTLFFDFYLPKIRVAIERDGQQHFYPVTFGSKNEKQAKIDFKDQKKRDSIKNKYCLDNDIYLIRIPYWEFKNTEEILVKELNLKL